MRLGKTAVPFFIASALLSVLWGTPSVVWAVVSFETRVLGGGQQFAYRWVDRAGRPQTLQFVLNINDIERGSSEFKPWDDKEAQTAAYRRVKDVAERLSGNGFWVSVEREYEGYRTRMRGADTPLTARRAAAAEKELEETYKTALAEYARLHFYTLTPQGGHQNVITPDHVALIKRYTAAMGPVATALNLQVLKGQGTPRDAMNAALGWLQSIPYDTLKDRYTSNGAGFQTPYGLMRDNRGDCDTKAVAFLALVRALYPHVPLAMIYIPQHAFVGIGIPQGPHDFALSTQHGVFVLADPTGPGLTRLGEIATDIQQELLARHTQVLVIQ